MRIKHNVALYARVSSDQQSKANTIGSQIAALEKTIAEDGHQLPPDMRFVDDGYSGATLVRPALERLRDCAALGEIDVLYVHAPDRLSRKYAYQAILIEEFTASGVGIHFVTNPPGETPEENLLLQVQGMIAEYERAKIIERHRRGKLHNARNGSVNVLSGAPYGYHYIRKSHDGMPARYEINFQEAVIVKRIFEWIGKQRLSIGEVSRRLTQSGIPTKTGKSVWDRSVIWAMLQNPAYMGKAAFGKTQIGKPLSRVRPQKHSSEQPKRACSSYRRDKEDWIEIKVPALISEELFELTQEQLGENRKTARQRRRGAAYLLQGLTVCGHCHYAYYGKPVSKARAKGKPKYAYYRCIGTDAYRFGGNRICDNRQIRTTILEDVVWEQVSELLNHPDRITMEYDRRLNEYEQQEAMKYDTTALEKQIGQLQQGVSRLIDGYTDGVIEKAEFEPKIKSIREKIQALDKQIIASRQIKNVQQELYLVVRRVDEFAEQIKSQMTKVDFETKRQIIRALVKRIEIFKDEVIIVFRVEPGSEPIDGVTSDAKVNVENQIMQDCKRSNLADSGQHLFALCVGSVVREGRQAEV